MCFRDRKKCGSLFFPLAGNGILFKHILVSFKRVFIGFSISFVCAFSLGMLAALKKKSGSLLWPVCGVYEKCASHQSDRPSHPSGLALGRLPR